MENFLIGLLIVCVAVIVAILGRGLWKALGCKMGWHSYKYEYQHFDGASVHAQCKWCKYKGLVDSQGNLF